MYLESFNDVCEVGLNIFGLGMMIYCLKSFNWRKK